MMKSPFDGAYPDCRDRALEGDGRNVEAAEAPVMAITSGSFRYPRKAP